MRMMKVFSQDTRLNYCPIIIFHNFKFLKTVLLLRHKLRCSQECEESQRQHQLPPAQFPLGWCSWRGGCWTWTSSPWPSCSLRGPGPGTYMSSVSPKVLPATNLLSQSSAGSWWFGSWSRCPWCRWTTWPCSGSPGWCRVWNINI